MKDTVKLGLVAVVAFIIGIAIGLTERADGETSYELVEDNYIETIIGIYEGDETTLISLNRWEGKMYVTTSDGKDVPETKEIE